jgi:hypothetical protein
VSGEAGFRGLLVYLLSVLLLKVVLPIVSVAAEHVYWHRAVPLMSLVGKWFVFWAAGIRLFFAGLSQSLQPRFTAEQLFGIRSEDALPFVRELGAANLSTGVVGIASLAKPGFTLPVAIAATVFYGIAGIRHAMDKGRTSKQTIAMISDLFVSLVLLAYVGFVALD